MPSIAGVCRSAVQSLADAGLEDAESVGRQAVAFLLNRSVPDLHRCAADPWQEALDARLAEALDRLAGNEPPAYVFGDVDFRGHRIVVDARVLAPRPETEQLVQAVLDDATLWSREPVRIADVCTGSGCIAVALALEQTLSRLVALDVSADALDVARINLAQHRLEDRVCLRRGEWLAGQAPESLDAVVSNPPYVTEAEWQALPPRVREHEPRLALVGGSDGLDAYRCLAPQAYRALSRSGRIYLEIGASQGASVSTLVAAAGFCDIQCFQDYQQRDRWIAATKKP